MFIEPHRAQRRGIVIRARALGERRPDQQPLPGGQLQKISLAVAGVARLRMQQKVLLHPVNRSSGVITTKPMADTRGQADKAADEHPENPEIFKVHAISIGSMSWNRPKVGQES